MTYRLLPHTVEHACDSELTGLSEFRGEFLSLRPMERLWELSGRGKGIAVGVCDTGVAQSHLDGDLSNLLDAEDFTGSRFGPADRNGHGTHVSCHIAGADDGSGMLGLAPECDLYHAKVLGDNGSGTSAGIARGIRWCIDQGCKIINLSLGGGYSQSVEDALIECKRNNVLVFAALGNSGARGDGHPGNSNYSIGIAAVDWQKRPASFTSHSDAAIQAGYGVNVPSCWINGGWRRISGTSMATPDTVGIAANLLAIEDYADNKEYFEKNKEFMRDISPTGWDRVTGYGFLDIAAKLDSLETAPDPGPDPDPDPTLPPEFNGTGILVKDGTPFVTDPSGTPYIVKLS